MHSRAKVGFPLIHVKKKNSHNYKCNVKLKF